MRIVPFASAALMVAALAGCAVVPAYPEPAVVYAAPPPPPAVVVQPSVSFGYYGYYGPRRPYWHRHWY